MQQLNLGSKTDASIERAAVQAARALMAGKYIYECRDAMGRLKWKGEAKNAITKEGLNHLLDVLLLAGTQVPAWYVGIYTSYVGNVLDLTGTDVGGNLVHFTSYTGNRKAYNGVRTAQTVSNTLSKAAFAILASGTIAGGFIANSASGTVTTLLSVDSFTTGSKPVSNGDTLNVTYELTASN